MAKETRLYGLFEKVEGKWVRLLPTLSFTRSKAVKVFQNALLAGIFDGKTRTLRVVKG